MLKLVLSVLVAVVCTTAVPASYWITEHIWKIDQTPLVGNAASFDSAAPSPQRQLSDLAASSDDPVSQAWSETFPPPAPSPQEQLSDLAASDDPVYQAWSATFPLHEIYPQGQLSELSSSNSVSLVYQFKDKAALENLAARSNGDLLLTATCHAEVYYLNPRGGGPQKICTFPEAVSTTGIVETAPDIFIVAVGNYSSTTYAGVPGSFSVWSVDLNGNPKKPTVKKITDIPEAEALNGMALLEGTSDVVLIADSSIGAIWRLNTTSGEYDMAIKHVLFTTCGSKFPLGINGISVFEDHVHFLNSAQQLYGRIAIDKTGSATAEPEIIARAGPGAFAWDDLAINWQGTAWIATHANAVTEVTLAGKQRNVTGTDDKTEMKQPTSLIFGRGSQAAEKTLYVVTAGGGQPGQVLSVDTRMI